MSRNYTKLAQMYRESCEEKSKAQHCSQLADLYMIGAGLQSLDLNCCFSMHVCNLHKDFILYLCRCIQTLRVIF